MSIFPLLPILACGMLLLALIALVATKRTPDWDNGFLSSLHFGLYDEPKIQSPKIRRMMEDLSALGGDTATVLFALFVTGFCVATNHLELLRSALPIVAIARLSGYALKKLFRRQRPQFIPNAPQIFTTSFPSVHSLMSATIFGWIGFIMPAELSLGFSVYLQILCGTVIFLIGYSRIYLGVHWPTDVLAGWLSGILILLVAALL